MLFALSLSMNTDKHSQKQIAIKKCTISKKSLGVGYRVAFLMGWGVFVIPYKYKFLAFLLCFALCIHYLKTDYLVGNTLLFLYILRVLIPYL